MKLLMEDREITVEQLAETSGLSEKTISRLRSGENKPPLPADTVAFVSDHSGRFI